QVEPLVAGIMDSDLAPAALELFSAAADPTGSTPADGFSLLVRFEGPQEAVEWQLAELSAAAPRHGATPHPPPVTEQQWEQVRDWAAGPWSWLAAAAVLGSDAAALVEAGQQVATTLGIGLEIGARAANGVVFFGARGPLVPSAARELTDRLREAATGR